MMENHIRKGDALLLTGQLVIFNVFAAILSVLLKFS